jgi:hypothetical protein
MRIGDVISTAERQLVLDGRMLVGCHFTFVKVLLYKVSLMKNRRKNR